MRTILWFSQPRYQEKNPGNEAGGSPRNLLVDISFYWPSKAKLAWTECTSFPYFILETDIHVAS